MREDLETRSGRRVGREHAVVSGLAALAALRVLASCALFPFFDNVDEAAHFDVVVKYSRGRPPSGLERYGRESAQMLALYATPEYLAPRAAFGGRLPVPFAALPPEAAAAGLPGAIAAWTAHANTESQEPPLYYALGGVWLALGRVLGLAGVALLYWLRALNALVAAVLVYLGHAIARAVFPDSKLQRLGVPLLLAVFPQDAFYSIGSDALSPLCFGLAFLEIVRFGAGGAPTRGAAARAGLALAATALVKASNLPLVGVGAAALGLRARRAAAECGARMAWGRLALAVACAGAPIGAWLVWNQLLHGDWTGTTAKVAALGWTRKPLGAWWPHPLFSGAGLFAFGSELLASFWRGEFVWRGERLAHAALDVFYAGSSLVLLGVALLRLPAAREPRRALLFAASCFAGGVAFLAVLSLGFDFGRCVYPSRAHPFFTSGRLLGGALIPFLLLYVHGLDRSLAFTASTRVRALALLAIAAAATASELWLDRAPFASAYNLFHFGG